MTARVTPCDLKYLIIFPSCPPASTRAGRRVRREPDPSRRRRPPPRACRRRPAARPARRFRVEAVSGDHSDGAGDFHGEVCQERLQDPAIRARSITAMTMATVSSRVPRPPEEGPPGVAVLTVPEKPAEDNHERDDPEAPRGIDDVDPGGVVEEGEPDPHDHRLEGDEDRPGPRRLRSGRTGRSGGAPDRSTSRGSTALPSPSRRRGTHRPKSRAQALTKTSLSPKTSALARVVRTVKAKWLPAPEVGEAITKIPSVVNTAANQRGPLGIVPATRTTASATKTTFVPISGVTSDTSPRRIAPKVSQWPTKKVVPITSGFHTSGQWISSIFTKSSGRKTSPRTRFER